MEGTQLSQDEAESVSRIAMDKLEKETASLTSADQAALEASDIESDDEEAEEDGIPPYVMRRRAAKLVFGLAGTAVCIGLAVLVMKYGPEGLAKLKAWRAAAPAPPAPAAPVAPAAAAAASVVPK